MPSSPIRAKLAPLEPSQLRNTLRRTVIRSSPIWPSDSALESFITMKELVSLPLTRPLPAKSLKKTLSCTRTSVTLLMSMCSSEPAWL